MSVKTVRMPGMRANSISVDPELMSFVNDLIFMTFYSESGIGSVFAGAGQEIQETMDARGITGSKYTGQALPPEDILSLMRSNISILLSEAPYKDGMVRGADVSLRLLEQTSRGNVVSYSLRVRSDAQLITGEFSGAVMYSLTASQT